MWFHARRLLIEERQLLWAATSLAADVSSVMFVLQGPLYAPLFGLPTGHYKLDLSKEMHR